MQVIKRITAIFFLHFSFVAPAIADKHELLLTEDSLKSVQNNITTNWLFMEGDNPSFASQDYNDTNWKETSTTLRITDTTEIPFSGIGWFRLHFISDSTVAGKPLALSISHYGASEIYLDGMLLKSYGEINGRDSSIYYDPQFLPFVFVMPPVGKHVLAVRYANYNAEKNYEKNGLTFAGFLMSIANAESQIQQKNLRSLILTFTLLLLCGIFLTLGIVHLFLFFYHRKDLSNLYFSIFMLCIALNFVIGFISFAGTSPRWLIRFNSFLGPLFAIAFISLSAFINTLFQKKMWRFSAIAAMGVVYFILYFLNSSFSIQVLFAIVISVSFDTVFTIIFAMIRRVKGARIIGTGIVFSMLFIITVFAIAFVTGENVDINDSTVGGQIFILLLGLTIISIPLSMSLYQAWRFAAINSDLGLQLEQVKVLSQKTLEQEKEKQHILENQKEVLERQVQERTSELRSEKKKSDDLLLNILPAETAEELKQKGSTEAKSYDEVTVMFTDFRNFTQASEKMSAKELVNEINYCYSEFDKIISEFNLEKIKTIGDSYMCAGGLPVANKTNAEDTVNAAISIRDFMEKEKQKRQAEERSYFEIRIGIHTGPVVAGIVGIKKFAYDIWGDTVNIASRMESSGETGKVNISGNTYNLVKEKFSCVHRGKIEAKNKGQIDMYFVN